MLTITSNGRICIDSAITSLSLTQSQSGTRVWDQSAPGWVALPRYRYRLFDQDERADLEESLRDYIDRSSAGV